MTFLAPARLWWLLAIPALVAAYVLLQRRRRAYVVRFTNLSLLADVAPRRPGWRRHVAAALLMLALGALFVGTARPAVTARVPKEQSSIILVVDVSRSMLATDLEPDRMTAAKNAATEFVSSLPKELRVGVVAFSDAAYLVSPLTRDREQTTRAIESLNPVGGTAIGDGLATALEEIARQRADEKEVPAAVLLLSDGASNRGRASAEVAQEAAVAEVPVFTVGVGTEGAVLQLGGRSIPVDLNEDELQGIAEATGGTYFRTADSNTLRAVYRDLGSELGFEKETREATAVAAAVAAALLVAAAAASLLWFQRIP